MKLQVEIASWPKYAHFTDLSIVDRDETMPVPEEYQDLDLYEVLGSTEKAAAGELRKAYLKKALKTHPDKGGDEKEFLRVAFAWSILGDETRRKRYDVSGSLEEFDDDVSIADLFTRDSRAEINDEVIAEFKKQYQGSDEEKSDILASYKKYKGNFDHVLETVMLSEAKDQERFIRILEDAIAKGEIDETAAFKKTTTKAALKKRLREAEKEAKEAAEQAKENNVEDMAGLAALIQSRQKRGFNDLISRLEAKYTKVDKPTKKKTKKKSA